MTTCTCSSPTRRPPLMERSSPLPEVTNDHLCPQCASIDLHAILRSEDLVGINNWPWNKSRLGSDCPLCRFLATVASVGHPDPPPGPDTEIKYRLDVRTFPNAFNPLLANATRDRTISDFRVVGVTTKWAHNSSYPDCSILPVDHNSQDPRWPALRELDPGSIDFGTLRSWLLHCQTHHSFSCSPPPAQRDIPGLKLIDCRSRQVVDAPESASYVALSYVWGKSHAVEVTDKSCLSETLPRTIEDAMQVVLRLNLQYLWVDKYCIDQSSNTELAQQISIMDKIYSYAFCTIIAAYGDDSSAGLPGVGLTKRPEQPAIRLNGQIWVSSLKDPMTLAETSAWASRAWTYQEGLFSRRRLMFTEEQVYFECNNTRCRETVGYDLHYLDDKMRYSPWGLFNGGFAFEAHGGLDTHIEAYTKRSLSFQSDIINALSGVLRLYSSMPTPTRHYWGIPMDYNMHHYSPWPANSAVIKRRPSLQFEGHLDSAFARALCWHLNTPGPRRPGFPSWSWAGWIGPLAYYGWGLLNKFGDTEVKIWLQRSDGGHERLSEEAIVDISTRGPPYSGYNPILRVEAWVIDVSLVYIAGGLDGAKSHPQQRNPDPRYFISARVPAAPWPWGIRGTSNWPVMLSGQVKEGDELHEELCRGTFTCVLLGKQSDFGLVVRRRADGVMERMGHVQTRLSYFDSEGPFDVVGDKENYRFWELSDYFPRVRRTVLLG